MSRAASKMYGRTHWSVDFQKLHSHETGFIMCLLTDFNGTSMVVESYVCATWYIYIHVVDNYLEILILDLKKKTTFLKISAAAGDN